MGNLLSRKASTLGPLEERILKTLDKLEDFEFEMFKFHLRRPEVLEGLDPIPKRKKENRRTIACLMVRSYSSPEAQKIIAIILNNIHRNDLLDNQIETSDAADPSMPTSSSTSRDVSKAVPHPEKTMASDQVSSVNILVANKVKLVEWLSADPYILQHLHADGILETRVYNRLMKTLPPEDAFIQLIDTVTNKGEGISYQFLKLLRKPEILKTYPQLTKWNSSFVLPGPPEPKITNSLPVPDFLVKTQKDTHPITYYQDKLKANVREPFASLPEGAVPSEDKKDYECYTRLTLVHADDTKTSSEHEVTQKQAGQEKKAGQDIQLSEIYKHPSRKNKRMRTVMSIGEAGVGKSFLANKFISDWAKNKDQDPHLTFLLQFRQLNLLRGQEFTLAQLIHTCIDASKCIPEEALDYIFNELQRSGNANYDLSPVKVMFVLEGLDECHLKLDWTVRSNDVTKATSLEILLVNLINGNLLRSAHLWITTRPAAAKMIDDSLVDLVTEVRGFTHDMIVKYIEKRFTDKVQASKIISHIKATTYLHIMCETPVFCSIIASVLQDMLTDDRRELPKTLADIYSHFIFVQTKRKWLKCGENRKKLTEADKAVLLKLGRLAFEHLQKGNIIFYEEDLERCDLDIKEGPVDSGLCTEIFKRESQFFQENVYCFVHLSIQEFLAAVYLFDCFTQKNKENVEVLKTFLNNDDFNCNSSLSDFLKAAMEKTVQSESGHLDLFNRFLHGLSLKSNKRLLGGLLCQADSGEKEIQKAITNLKEMDPCSGSPDRCINIFQCLMEMKASSVSQGIQQYLESGKELSVIQCSALVRMLQMSEEVLEELDLTKCKTAYGGRETLIPAVRNCTTARLGGCKLKKEHIEVVASALSSNPSHLRHLDLSYNDLSQLDLEPLKAALNSPHCKLETLRLVGCDLQKEHIEVVASALSSNPSHLRHLDLSYNDLLDLEPLKAALNSPHCKLETLRLIHCWLSERSCEVLASFLSSNPSHLRELDASLNRLLDSGIEFLCAGVKSPHQLQTLKLSGCGITEKGCSSLASAVALNSSHLKHLDISCNNPGGDAVQTLLSAGLDVNVNHGGEHWIEHWTNPQLLKRYFQILSLDTNTAHSWLSLSQNNRKATRVSNDQNYPPHADRFDGQRQVLCTEGLTGRCYWEVEWRGEVKIAVTYREISRKGRGGDCRLGWNELSWSLYCGDSYYVSHNSKRTVLPVSPSGDGGSGRVAVYLDCPAGILSFYEVSEDTLTHLYTVKNTFTGPLYAGFWLDWDSSSVCLCEQSRVSM